MDLTGIGGIWPASLTPFDGTGAIDEAALHAHLAELAGTPGVRAVVVNGHAGETSALTHKERAHIIRAAKAAAGDAAGVVAGIVADDTPGAVALAQDAAQAGADALLLFPPALFAQGANARPDMASRFVAAVARASALPIVLFQLSLASGLGFSRDVLLRLCHENESIIAIKEGSDTPQAYEDNLVALRALDRPVTVLTTNNSWLMASLAYGGDGILSGIGSVAAPILAEIFAAMARGDLAVARSANARLRPLCRAFYRAPHLDSHNRMKTALHLLGKLPNPDPRAPLLPIEPEERAAIARALIDAGLLADHAAAA